MYISKLIVSFSLIIPMMPFHFDHSFSVNKKSHLNAKTLDDLNYLSSKDSIRAVCGPRLENQVQFVGVDVVTKSPTTCKFIIGNPKAFFENKETAKAYGIDFESYNRSTSLMDLAEVLPVIYIADIHSEYGTLGFQLNRPLTTMESLRPELKAFRKSPVFAGGVKNKGSSFTMVHKKAGFPENRPWKGIPGNSDFRFFFSPDVAMANELCLTGDASPLEFK